MKRDVPPLLLATQRGRISFLFLAALAAQAGVSSISWAQAAQDAAQTADTVDGESQSEGEGLLPESPDSEPPVKMNHLVAYLVLEESQLSRARIAQALEDEFHVPVAWSKTPAGLNLVIRGEQLSASFETETGAVVEREMDLPSDPANQLTTIALLSGSIARDESGALIALLRAPVPEPLLDDETSRTEVPPPEEGTADPDPPVETPPPSETKAPVKTPSPEKDPLPQVLASASLTGSLTYPRALPKKKTHLHIGAISSDIGSLDGVAASLIAHRNRGTDRDGAGSGVQLAVAFLHTGGDFKGVNASALVASGSGQLNGALLGGLFSLQRGDLFGPQLSGLTSVSVGDTVGVQLAGLGALQLGGIEGVQAAGLFVYTRGDVLGFQGSALSTMAGGRVKGTQLAALSTYAGQGVSGYQMALVNVARKRLDGVQLGLVNVAGDFKGTQLGLINIGGKGKGNQIALMNIGKDLDGAAIAPINIIPGIRHQLLTYASYFPSRKKEGTPDGPLVHLGVKFLPGKVYTQLGFGMGIESEECERSGSEPEVEQCYGGGIIYAPSFAIGVRSEFNRVLHLDVDMQYQFMRGFNQSRSSLHQMLGRAALGIQFAPAFGFFVGAAPQVQFYEGPRVESPPSVSVGWTAFSGLSFF